MHKHVRAGAMCALLSAFFIYMLVGKPDYKILNALDGAVIPVAGAIADGATYPLRLAGRIADGARELAGARNENRELRAKLDEALRAQNDCHALSAENQRLSRELDIARGIPGGAAVARVVHDNSALAHSTFIINKGADHGLGPGMAVMSPDGNLAGVITSATAAQAKVRALADLKSNIPVRVAGTDVYGFLRGNGASAAVFEFYSDPEFIPTPGSRLITSGIKGSLPDNIPAAIVAGVGKTASTAEIAADVRKLHDVFIVRFKEGGGY
jgi:rod shape-determining protein MreC